MSFCWHHAETRAWSGEGRVPSADSYGDAPGWLVVPNRKHLRECITVATTGQQTLWGGGRPEARRHRHLPPDLTSLLQNSCPPTSELLGSPRLLFWDPIRVHDIRWNFEKFLVGPDGVPVMRWFHKAPVSVVKSDILEYLKQFEAQ